jgi:hypothetical protein
MREILTIILIILLCYLGIIALFTKKDLCNLQSYNNKQYTISGESIAG